MLLRMNIQKLSEAISHLIPEMIRGAQMDFFIESPITQTQMMLLIAIRSFGSCPMSHLAREMKVSKATVSGIVGRLARVGYITRTPSQKDRREIWVKVTPSGEKFMADFRGVIRERWKKVIGILSEREMQHFYSIVEKLKGEVRRSS